MADNINFRSAMRGYNKEDVNRFILDSDRLHRESEAELQEKIQSISEERDILRDELTAAKQSVTQTEAALDEKINALVSAEARIKELEDVLAQKDARLADSAVTASEMEQLLSESERALSDTKKELTARNGEIATLKESLNTAAKNCASKEEEIGKLQEESKLLAESLKTKEHELLHLEDEKNSLEQSNKELGEKLLSLENENASLKEAAQAEDTEIPQEGDYGQLLIEFESLKAELIHLQMENESLRTQAAAIPDVTVTDDILQSRLGEVILQANRTAEQIIREANNTAKLIKMGAVEEATVIKKNFEDKMQQRAERAERLLGELSDRYFNEFESTKAALEQQVSELLELKKVS